MKVHIVDYGMGNIFSVQKKLLQEHAIVSISSKPEDILDADKVILLGVGHVEKAMNNLTELDLLDSLNNFALIEKKPILGICLGMQLMAETSDEGNGKIRGLGWINASVKKFYTQESQKFKIPHIGWNNVHTLKNSKLMKDITSKDEFYFVHSYYMEPLDEDVILNETSYIEKFCSGVEKDNIFGVQYHPEKSHDSGRTVLRNFINL